MEENYVITIARGFGTGGKVLAMRLAEELGIECYEHRILALCSQQSELQYEKYVNSDENISNVGFWNRQLRKVKGITTPLPQKDRFIADDELFARQTKVINDLADSESCVIVGKCADYILKDRKNVISIYIEAPRRYCLKRIMDRMDVSESEAHRLISRTDRYRAEYYEYYTGGNYWTNPVNYDMTFNMERVGEDNCVEIIKEYVSKKLGRQMC